MSKSLIHILIAPFILFCSSVFASDKLSNEGDFHRFYIGGFGGASKTLSNSFKDKETGTTFVMKSPSPFYGAMVGYRITPDISMELSFEQKSRYPVKIQLDPKYGGDKVASRASANAFMLHFVYNLNDYSGFQPFVKLGLGLEQIKLKQANIPLPQIPLPQGLLPVTGGHKLRTANHTSNCLAMELGLGVSKKITNEFAVNVGANLHIAKNAKMKAYAFNEDKTKAAFMQKMMNGTQPTANDIVYDMKTIKQTFGVGEISIGFTYDLPI